MSKSLANYLHIQWCSHCLLTEFFKYYFLKNICNNQNVLECCTRWIISVFCQYCNETHEAEGCGKVRQIWTEGSSSSSSPGLVWERWISDGISKQQLLQDSLLISWLFLWAVEPLEDGGRFLQLSVTVRVTPQQSQSYSNFTGNIHLSSIYLSASLKSSLCFYIKHILRFSFLSCHHFDLLHQNFNSVSTF